jgi:hypothetical protein
LDWDISAEKPTTQLISGWLDWNINAAATHHSNIIINALQHMLAAVPS